MNLDELLFHLNSGRKLVSISQETGIRVSKLSSMINSAMERGTVAKTLMIPLHLISSGVSVSLVEMNQKTRLDKCVTDSKDVILTYVSVESRVRLIMYLRGGHDITDFQDIVNLGVCKPIEVARLEGVVTAEYDPRRRVFITEKIASPQEAYTDNTDEYVAIQLFKVFSPPVFTKWNFIDLVGFLSSQLGEKTAKYHLYKHVLKLAKKRYVRKNGGVYGLMWFNADSLASLTQLLTELANAEIVIGVNRIDTYSAYPFMGVAHIWINLSRYLNPLITHNFVENTSYHIYVPQIITGIPKLASSPFK